MTDLNSFNSSGTVREQVFDSQNRAWDEGKSLIDASMDAVRSMTDIAEQFETSPSAINALRIDDARINQYLAWLEGDFTHGLNPGVEEMNWDRMRERTSAVLRDTVTQISRRVSAAGWEQPPGAMFEKISEAEQFAATEMAGQARDVAIQQNQYEIDAFRNVLNSLLQLMQAKAAMDGDKIRLTMANTQANFGYLIEAVKANSQVAAQLAASVLSALNFNASTSSSTGASMSHSDNVSYDGGDGTPPVMILPL